MKNAPCKECGERYEACWSSCQKYKEFRVEADKIAAGRNAKQEADRIYYAGRKKKKR